MVGQVGKKASDTARGMESSMGFCNIKSARGIESSVGIFETVPSKIDISEKGAEVKNEDEGGHALNSSLPVVKGGAQHGIGGGPAADGVHEEGGRALHSPRPDQGGGEDRVLDAALYTESLV